MPWLVSSPRFRERWSDDESESRFFSPGDPSAFGLGILLASLGMVFGALIVLALWLRSQYAAWPPPGLPRVPVVGLATATILLPSVGICTQIAARALARAHFAAVRGWVGAALALSLSFLLAQSGNWSAMLATIDVFSASRPIAFLCLFAVLHALHVIGGMSVLAIIALRVFRRRCAPHQAGGIRRCAAYWHFLDIVWLAMLAVLLIPSGSPSAAT